MLEISRKYAYERCCKSYTHASKYKAESINIGKRDSIECSGASRDGKSWLQIDEERDSKRRYLHFVLFSLNLEIWKTEEIMSEIVLEMEEQI